MKNYLLNLKTIKLFLFIISIWLIGSSSAFGQGWVKKYYIDSNYNVLLDITTYNNNIIVINEDITNSLKKILVYDPLGNIIDSNTINYNFVKSENYNLINIDQQGNLSFISETSNQKINLIKVRIDGSFLKDTTIDGQIFIDLRYSNLNICKGNVLNYSLFDLDSNFHLTNELKLKNIDKSKVVKFNTNYLYINNSSIESRDYNSIKIWKTDLPVEILEYYCFYINNNYIFINIDINKNVSLFKIDQNGNIINSRINMFTLPNWGYLGSIKSEENKIFFSIVGQDPNSLIFDSELIVINDNLNFECQNFNLIDINNRFNSIINLISLNNYYYIIGNTGQIAGLHKSQIVKLTNTCDLYTNELNIKYFLDDNKDCIKNNNERLLKNKLINIIDKYQQDNYYISNIDSLLIDLDTGTYVIHPIAPIYFQLCEDSISFAHNKYYDTVRIEIPMKPIVICPYLEIDISTPILRRCFDNTYSVHYCNQGTADAKGVYIEVELDKWLSYKSSSIPLKNQLGNLLIFDIGNLPIGECGDFQILTYLNCDSTILGQTHCTNAHIFPDSLCLPTNGWDGSRIRVSGQCLGDSIRYEIKNASNSPMLQQSNYIVVEDEIIMSKKPFQLGANETLKINIPVYGRTYRLEAEQSIGHPGSSKPTVTVENCGVGPVSLGFVNQFYQDDADPFIDIDCQQNRGSYDPNDKQGYPLGYGKNHFIEQNQSIEYHIRFQNTGSDTAFTIRIQDTLSNHLDPTTFVAGASSHPYSYRIFGNGIVEFLFDPIALPDSNVNNAKSIGFVKFTISQKKDLPIGSEIKNKALIYFDYNSPIVTNSTLHTVGKNFITITETSEVDPSSLKIYPNPFAQEAIIEVDNNDVDKIFELYDLYGRKIKEEKFVGNQLNFKRNHLQSGMYFFKITSKNKPLTQGKLIIH